MNWLDSFLRRHPAWFVAAIVLLAIAATVAIRMTSVQGSMVVYQAF
jgi:hypothetical protein